MVSKFLVQWVIVLSGILLWMFVHGEPGSDSSSIGSILTLVVVSAAVAALSVALARGRTRREQRCVQELQRFASALPAHEITLSETEPPALQGLTRAMKDMAERVHHVVERANMESARREAILAAMAEGVLAVDGDLRVVFCNDAFAQAFQARVPNDESRMLYEVVREPLLRDILQRVAKTGLAERDRFQLPTAGSRWFEARTLPLASVPRPGALVVLHDVTDLHSQEQLRKDFVADVSHELRTPLAAIRGYAETLLDGALEDQANNRRFVEIIMSHAIRLNDIASDLLVLSELDAQTQLTFSPEPIFLPEVVQSAVQSVADAASKRSVHLIWDQCEPCFIQGVRFRLEQALVNLLDNAVKFNREGGEVRVRCHHGDTPGHVGITVADTGLGIPSSDLKRIFERFYRVDKARARPAGGTGLGLPIVKEIVERMGGSVTVQSQLGKGSEFQLVLLEAKTPQGPVPEPDAKLPPVFNDL